MIWWFSCLLLGMNSCENNSPDSGDDANTSKQTATENALTPMTPEFFKRIDAECDYVDILFYNQDFSVSLHDSLGIKSFLAIISKDPAQLPADCPSQGRAFFQSKGKVICEADIHYIPGKCRSFVFFENGKKVHANLLNDNGETLFANYFSRGLQMNTPEEGKQ